MADERTAPARRTSERGLPIFSSDLPVLSLSPRYSSTVYSVCTIIPAQSYVQKERKKRKERRDRQTDRQLQQQWHGTHLTIKVKEASTRLASPAAAVACSFSNS